MSGSLIKLIGSKFGRRRAEGDENDEWMTVDLTQDQLDSTTVGLYFANMQSAKSKEFTKVLLEFVQQMKKSCAAGASSLSSSSAESPPSSSSTTFQIIIIFFDETEKIVHLDHTQTPFLHFEGDGARARQEYLIRKYGVNETPTLILMDGSTGGVINFHGREKMLEDPTGANFPWTHSSCTDILSASRLIVSGDTNSVTTEDQRQGRMQLLKESVKGILFAAFWYPPCRGFISSLIDVYTKVRDRGHNFEIVFVTSDRSQESFDRFFSQMPWFAVPYEDEGARRDLTALLNVKSIPTLVVLDAQDNIITPEGRLEVNDDLEGFDFPWYPKVVEELRDRHSSVLNSSLSLIYFIGEDDDEYDKAEGVLVPIASQIISDPETEEPFQPKFFIGTDSELSEELRLFIDMEDTKSVILILDIPNYRYAILQEAIEDEKCVKDFLHKFQTAQLQYKYIQSRFI